MTELFACNPNCVLTDLGMGEWLVILLFLSLIILATSILRKWAFVWNKSPESSFKWHIPRFAFISFTVAVITIPGVNFLLGNDWAYIYAKVVLAPICIAAYLGWLVLFDTTKHER